jgi:hypothetical protein
MPDDLKQIDTSAIGELVRIRDEEDRFQERLQKMESGRGTVSPAVFERVQRDYTSRLEALDAEARPLRDRARAEYAKLRVLQSEAERALQEVGLAKEELEFRNSLGEYQDGDFATRLAACQQNVADRKAWADEIGRMREQFRKAFRPRRSSRPRFRAGRRNADRVRRKGLARDRPRRLRTPVTTQVARALLAGKRSRRPRRASSGSSTARRTGSSRSVPTRTRSAATRCEIELPFTEVSRRHAEIRLGPDGFRVVDLSSNNGVYVNGKKVKEQVLVDGDLIQVGTQNLRFRA